MKKTRAEVTTVEGGLPLLLSSTFLIMTFVTAFLMHVLPLIFKSIEWGWGVQILFFLLAFIAFISTIVLIFQIAISG